MLSFKLLENNSIRQGYCHSHYLISEICCLIEKNEKEKKKALAFIRFCRIGLTRLFILTWEYDAFNTLINCTVLIDGCVALSRWSGKRVHVLSLHIELSVSLWMNVSRWGGLYYWWVSAGLQMGGSVDTVMILMYSQFGSASHNSCFVQQKTIQTA